MPSFAPSPGNVLYLIVCAAPPAADTADVVKAKQADGWDVCVIATETALDWFDPDQIEALTGHEVRSQFRKPGAESFEPLGNAVLVSPATFNTINKWALGINDTVALGLLNEALGRQVPIEAKPYLNDALASHPAYRQALEVLSSLGVQVTAT
jgi:phosphopantothenoylcysteine synthetase/decarboxylase